MGTKLTVKDVGGIQKLNAEMRHMLSIGPFKGVGRVVKIYS